MMKMQGEKQVNRLAFFFAATYMVSYITRINYGAVLSEMESATQMSKSLLGMAPTGSFITYGVGQIISGICGDQYSPKKLVFYGLTVTTLMNLLIPLCQNPYQMLVVWCINGFAQAFLWPPLVRLMTALLSDDDYKKAMVKVLWGSSLGTIVVYLISPLLISTLGWKSVFVFSAICGVVMVIVWNKYAYEIQSGQKKTVSSRKGPDISLFTSLMICIMLAIICMGMLRDGITTWMPSYISETYHLNSSISILTGVLLPIFGIICFQIASRLYRKTFTNPLLCAGVIFAAGTSAALGLFLFSEQNVVFSVLFSAALTGCMHGVNLMLISMIPPFFQKRGNVSTVSGVLNSCTYIGSALSTYGIALLSERLGWKYTLFTWILIGAAGTMLCLISVRPWDRDFKAE